MSDIQHSRKKKKKICKKWLFDQNRYFNVDLQSNYFIIAWLGDVLEFPKIQGHKLSAAESVLLPGTAEMAVPGQTQAQEGAG